MNTLGPLSHIALVVSDAARTAEFFSTLFAAEVTLPDGGSGPDEICVTMGNTTFVLAQAEVDRPLLGDHVAFSVSKRQLHEYAEKLEQLGHSYQMARGDTALYFTDFDNHVLELECDE